MNFEDSMPSGWLKTTSARRPHDCDRTLTTGTLAVSMISNQLISPLERRWSASIFIAVPVLHGTSVTATSTSPLGSDKPVKKDPNTKTLQPGHSALQASLIVWTHFRRACTSSCVCCMKSTKSNSSSCRRSTAFSMWGRGTNQGGCPSSATLFEGALFELVTPMKASGAAAVCSSRASSLRFLSRLRMAEFRSACSAFLSASSS
mmetsp:Transcript_54955/g.102938  ORF Transcript_54955/g.102938 Transcript_54955/m.102938 type:complete len:204 (+) Transcript_54955:812-1423(+)